MNNTARDYVYSVFSFFALTDFTHTALRDTIAYSICTVFAHHTRYVVTERRVHCGKENENKQPPLSASVIFF